MASGELDSIYALAQATGVSVSTVSRVMNQRGRISEETRVRVLAAARAAGFRPRMAARQVTVAVVVDRLGFASFGGFCSSMLLHLVNELSRHDVAVEVYSENNVERLGSRFIDGVLGLTWDNRTIAQLHRLKRVPVVLINRLDLPEVSAVATDHRQGGRLVADYLLDRGHRCIAMLAEERDWGARERIAGLRDGLEARGLHLDDDLIGLTQHQPIYGVLRRLLEAKPTALFVGGEDLALEASYVLTEVLRVDVPGQLSLVGMESERVAAFVRPPLTTLRQPLQKLATDALKLLMDMIESGKHKPRTLVLDNDIVTRQSVSSIEAEIAV